MARSILGAILAGGRSTRFGSDKALALLDGRPLIEHAAATLAPYTAKLVICGRSHPRWTCLPDQPAPGMGPLGGLAAALTHARDEGFDAVLSTGCDMPSLPRALVETLIGDGPAVVEGQQLIGYWPADLAGRLLDHLGHCARRSIREWMAVVEPRIVVPADPLPNINRPDDLAAWREQR
jgi:molybdopterin-guanine dinucleotide biosynthesis protein A